MELSTNQPAIEVQSPEMSPTEEQTVKLWIKRIKAAKVYFKDDFDRMRENMEFAAGLQWMGQESINDKDERYIANFITHHVNNKVASLYARDPKAIARCRKRLNYQLWDGSAEQEMGAQMTLQSSAMMGQMAPQAAQAQMLLADIQQGQQWEKLCKKVGETLEILYGYQCDVQSPSFKFQMKQLVRRVVTCGVGFVRLNYVQDFDHVLSSSLTDDSLAVRIKQAKSIMEGIDDDTISDEDPRVEQLRLLLESVQTSIKEGDTTNIEQRLEFDFPDVDRIIVDEKCKCLKGFIGADWVAHEFLYPLSKANAYFELSGDKKIVTGGTFIQYGPNAQEKPQPSQDAKPEDVQKEPLGCFWEVFDLTTKSHFFVCDGHRWYVQAPQPVSPSINRFWPIFSLTFNDIEVDSNMKVHIYPPSDVQLLKPMQKERNRIRQELREHRITNRPFFWALNGTIAEDDLKKLAEHETGELITLKSVPMGAGGQQNVTDAIGKWEGVTIKQEMYTTQPLDEDASLAVGSNAIQQGAPIRHVAATPAVIQEQSRMSGVNSNVDDLDDLLSELAGASGEMMLRVFNPQTVQRIVGRGGVFPDQQREDFLNEVYLDIVASSSGRPNKAVEIANFERIAPTLMQAMMNPALWPIVEEGVKRLDDRLDLQPFIKASQLAAQQMQQAQMSQQQPKQGLQQQQQKQAPPHQVTGQQHLSANPMPGIAQ